MPPSGGSTTKSKMHTMDTPTILPINTPAYDPSSTSCQQYLKRALEPIEDDCKPPAKRPRRERHAELRQYQQEVLGVNLDASKSQGIGELDCYNDDSIVCNGNGIDTSVATASEKTTDIDSETVRIVAEAEAVVIRKELPTVTELFDGGFGKPSKNHSFTQEASFETVVFQVMKSDYLTEDGILNLQAAHPLLHHLYEMMKIYSKVDFRPLREYNWNYASQKEIPQSRIKMFMACLFHYDLSVANVMRFLGKNYTGGYRNIEKAVQRMRGLVDDDLLTDYVRIMTVGAPAHFVAESSRENALLHWRRGNDSSIAANMELVNKAMNKMDKHNFVIPILSWIARFVPHIFFTPHHLLQKPGKEPRLICDASRRFTPHSVPVNRMTSTHLGVERECDYGTVLTRLLVRIWNLRISYPGRDIVLHANDVKSCFRQMKHHPDVMGAFSYIIADILYLSCALTMGSDFSPGTWEVPRRMAEQLATRLFEDKSLVVKHRAYLNNLNWSKKLGKVRERDLIPAHATADHRGVSDENGKPTNTPHHLFVDDDVYAEVYDVSRVEQTIAAGIESMFVILGESDLDKRQDPVSWDKLYEMAINFTNKILGQFINTRKMTIETPSEFIAKVVKLLETTWRGGKNGRKSFLIKEAENLAGLLGHISNTAPWLKHLMSQVYTSILYALKNNTSYLIGTNKHFREQLKIAKTEAFDEKGEMEKSFAQAETAKRVHNLKKVHLIPPTLHEELDLIRQALKADWISKASPIAHHIPDLEDGDAFGDSSLDSAGGWSIPMRFWWWIDWPEKIRQRTLRFVKDGKSGELIDINALEYATILINYAACIHFWVVEGNCKSKNIPYPRVQIYADNTAAESWALKGCKRSLVGRRVGRLQCALMINNPVGLSTGRIDTKSNVIADRISRWKSEHDTLLGFDTLMQEFPQLKSCRRFHPSPELISWVLDALSSKKLLNPLELSRKLLSNPGKVAS